MCVLTLGRAHNTNLSVLHVLVDAQRVKVLATATAKHACQASTCMMDGVEITAMIALRTVTVLEDGIATNPLFRASTNAAPALVNAQRVLVPETATAEAVRQTIMHTMQMVARRTTAMNVPAKRAASAPRPYHLPARLHVTMESWASGTMTQRASQPRFNAMNRVTGASGVSPQAPVA